jgi:predicted patatin/cPLA2 family phospholipase
MSIENTTTTTADIVTTNTTDDTTTTNHIVNSVDASTPTPTPIIKHLVIGGGGPFGLTAFGALKYLHEQHFWDIKNIKTIYATSIGALISIYLTMGYEYDYVTEYMVKRPWEKLFEDIGFQNIFDLYTNKGIIDVYPIYMKAYNILFEAKGLSPNITMKEFYEYSKIELNFITCDVNRFSKIIISHKTHPDTEIISALCMTSAFPVIFKPVIVEDKCYTDGGIFSNYAVNICLEETGCKKEEILGIKKYQSMDKNDDLITEESNIIDYLEKITINILNHINDEYILEKIPYEIICNMNIVSSYDSWIQVPFSSEHRAKLINYGVELSEKKLDEFLLHRDEHNNNTDR